MVSALSLTLVLALSALSNSATEVTVEEGLRNFHAFRLIDELRAPISFVHIRLEWPVAELFSLVMSTCYCSESAWAIDRDMNNLLVKLTSQEFRDFVKSRAMKQQHLCDEVHRHIENFRQLLNLPPLRHELLRDYLANNMGDGTIVQEMFNHHSGHRGKRQIGLAIAAGGLTVGGLMGLGSILFSGGTPSGHFHHSIKELEALKATERNIFMLNMTLSNIERARQDWGSFTKVSLMMEQCEIVGEESLRLIDKAYVILNSLNDRKVPSEVLLHLNLTQEMAKIKAQISSYGYSPISDNPYDLLTAETSYQTYSNSSIVIYMHMPIGKETMELYQHIPMPLHPSLSNETVMMNHDRAYLAISHDRTKFRELQSITPCKYFGNSFYCPGMNIMQLNSKESCLASLFREETSQVSQVCTFVEGPAHAVYEQLSDTEYFVSAPQTISVRTVCDGKSQGTKQLRGRVAINIPHGCAIIASNFAITPEVSVEANKELRRFELRQESVNEYHNQTTGPGKMLEMLANFTAQQQQHMANKLEQMPDLDDMIEQATKEQQSSSIWHFSSLQLILFGVLSMISLLSFLCCAYLCCCRREAVHVSVGAEGGSRFGSLFQGRGPIWRRRRRERPDPRNLGYPVDADDLETTFMSSGHSTLPLRGRQSTRATSTRRQQQPTTQPRRTYTSYPRDHAENEPLQSSSAPAGGASAPPREDLSDGDNDSGSPPLEMHSLRPLTQDVPASS